MANFDIREGNTSLNQITGDASVLHNITNRTRSPLVLVAAEFVTVGTGAEKLIPIDGTEVAIKTGEVGVVDYSGEATAEGVFQLSASELVDNTFDSIWVVDTTPLAKKSKAKAKTEGE